MLWCYIAAVKLILLYAIGLHYYCAFDVTICCNVTLLRIYQYYCILLCYLTWLLLLRGIALPFYCVINIAIASIITCSFDTRVNIWYNVTLLLCYYDKIQQNVTLLLCYCMLQRYLVTILLTLLYGMVLPCNCVTNVTIIYCNAM